MRIFVLEDDPDRIITLSNFFRPFLDDGTITEINWASSNWQRDKFERPYDLILLDHDLGGRQLTPHEDDGLKFIRSIKDEIYDAFVILHSYNPEGVTAMHAEYPVAVPVPFDTPQFWSLIKAILSAGLRT